MSQHLQPPSYRIAISTSGGDAPGINAVIRTIVISGLNRGWQVFGVHDGFHGLIEPEKYDDKGLIELSKEAVTGITHLGGTILGASHRDNTLFFPTLTLDVQLVDDDLITKVANNLRLNKIDVLIAIGGDESLKIANALSLKNISVIAIPKTIDNNLDKTDATIGFDSAVEYATKILDRLRTAKANDGVIIVEVMGQETGWIALYAGFSGSANIILIPEIPYVIDNVIQKIQQCNAHGDEFPLIVVAEGARPIGKDFQVSGNNLDELDRTGENVAREINTLTRKQVEVIVLGHLLRGGAPTVFDRFLAIRLGGAAVRAIEQGNSGKMIVISSSKISCVPISTVVSSGKPIDLNCDIIKTARDMGISFGDS